MFKKILKEYLFYTTVISMTEEESLMKKSFDKLLQSDEGKLFFTGLCLDILSVTAILILILMGSPWSMKIVSMLVTHIMSGRAGGISVGVEVGLPTWFIICSATLIDSLIVLLLYPLFVFSYRNMVPIKFLRDMIDTSREAAEKQKETIRRFGIVGLLLFVWFPLHMTGPLVGAIIGHFLGMKPYKTIAVVLSGTFLAVVSWVVFFRKMMVVTGSFSYLVPVVVVLLALIAFFVYRRKRRKTKDEDNDDTPTLTP